MPGPGRLTGALDHPPSPPPHHRRNRPAPPRDRTPAARRCRRRGERDQSGGFGALPLIGGPVRAGRGIEIGDGDVIGQRRTGAAPAIGPGERNDGGEIGIARLPGGPQPQEQPGARRPLPPFDQIEKRIEFLRDQPRGVVRAIIGERFGMAIEPGEDRGGKAIVITVAGNRLAIGAGIGIDLAIERTGDQHIGDLVAREQRRRLPAKRERRPRRAPAKRIGRLVRHPDDPARRLHPVPLCNGGQEIALAFGGPAIGAFGARVQVRVGIDRRQRRTGSGHSRGGFGGVRRCLGGGDHIGEGAHAVMPWW